MRGLSNTATRKLRATLRIDERKLPGGGEPDERDEFVGARRFNERMVPCIASGRSGLAVVPRAERVARWAAVRPAIGGLLGLSLAQKDRRASLIETRLFYPWDWSRKSQIRGSGGAQPARAGTRSREFDRVDSIDSVGRQDFTEGIGGNC